MKAGIDGFVILLLAVIILAWLWPTPGAYRGPFNLELIADWGVSLIFLFYGIKLDPSKLKEDLSNWRLHLLTQLSTFILFPLAILFIIKTIPHNPENYIWTGIFFLAALPSTVSSSVVMVSLARGNVPAAIFNASVSSVAGVVITPLWMQAVITSPAESIDLSHVLIKLSLQVLLPVLVGIMLHRRFSLFVVHHRQGLKMFDQTVILLIVYTAFCESFANGMFDSQSTSQIFILSLSMIGLFFIIFALITILAKTLKFKTADLITAQFCGTKKSLVHGTVMSKALFPHSANLGVILLPLMIFHTIQLIIASIIAQRYDKRRKN